MSLKVISRNETQLGYSIKSSRCFSRHVLVVFNNLLHIMLGINESILVKIQTFTACQVSKLSGNFNIFIILTSSRKVSFRLLFLATKFQESNIVFGVFRQLF